MRLNFKSTLLVLLSSCGVATLTTTMPVAASGIDNHRLFRSLSNERIITKQDLGSEKIHFPKPHPEEIQLSFPKRTTQLVTPPVNRSIISNTSIYE